MSLEIIEWIGPAPSDEDCAQTGEIDFHERNKAECKRFMDLLNKIYAPPSNNVCFAIHTEKGHEFGNYREVVIKADIDNIIVAEKLIIDKWIDAIHKMPNTWIELEKNVSV